MTAENHRDMTEAMDPLAKEREEQRRMLAPIASGVAGYIARESEQRRTIADLAGSLAIPAAAELERFRQITATMSSGIVGHLAKDIGLHQKMTDALTSPMAKEMERQRKITEAITRPLIRDIENQRRMFAPIASSLAGYIARESEQHRKIADLTSSLAVPAAAELERWRQITAGMGGSLAATMNSSLAGIIAKDMQRYQQLSAGVGSQLARMSQLAALASRTLERLPVADLGKALGAGLARHDAIFKTSRAFSTAFEALSAPVAAGPPPFLRLPPSLFSLPSVDFFTHADLLESATVEEEPGLAEAKQPFREDIATDTETSLTALLTAAFPELVDMLHGARQAFRDRRPDYVRHVTTSLRELFTHVLHQLSPDDDLKQWSTSEKDFDRGRPTRNARLRFICRGIDGGPFCKFVEKDISAALAFLEIIQGGTHGARPGYTEIQLTAIQARMEGLLRFLLEIAPPAGRPRGQH